MAISGIRRRIFGVTIAVLTIFFLSVINKTYGQISFGGRPFSNGREAIKSIPVITLSSFDRDKFLKEITPPDPRFKQFPVARDIAVMYNPGNSGLWNETKDGRLIWRVGFRSPGARSIAVTFNTFNIPSGAEVFVYGLEDRNYLGAFTSGNVKPCKSLTVAPVSGEVIIIEYLVPGNKPCFDDLQIGLISHGLETRSDKMVPLDSLSGVSGFCNPDINCNEGEAWQKEKRSVCRILVHKYIVQPGGDTTRWAELCSGVMVNDSRNSGRPFVLTASHCIGNAYEAEHALFFYDYESPYCNGPDGSNRKSLSGSALLASSGQIDFSLVELYDIPPFLYAPYYAGWSRSNSPPFSTVCIHHPQGDVKKIAIDSHQPLTSSYGGYDPNAFWLIERWETGTTEIGSSGAPLFDPDHRIAGLLSGGIATCPNPVTDYFSKFSSSWANYPDSVNQLKYWLDPDGIDIITMSGLDPYYISKQTCDTVHNIQEPENLLLYDYGVPGEGYWTGHNAGRYTRYAEKIINSEDNTVAGVYMYIARAEYNDVDDHIKLIIWEGSSYPEELISSRDVPINGFSDSSWCFVEFDSLIQVTGDFWIGYELYYDSLTSLTDQFALFQTENRGISGTNTAYAYKEGSWNEFRSIPPLNLATSLGIRIVLCNEVIPMSLPDFPGPSGQKKFLVYPNPSAGDFVIKHTNPSGSELKIQVFDLTGRMVLNDEQSGSRESFKIRMTNPVSGMYIIRIIEGKAVYTAKITITK